MRFLFILVALLTGCDASSSSIDAPDQAALDAALDGVVDDAAKEDAGADSATPDAAPPPRETAWIGHAFGDYDLRPFQETLPCVQWTLNNERALYVETVELETGGAFHHSNWYVVPEDKFPGDDGFFRCNDRTFSELAAAIAGTVLFAQSTQARYEAQTLKPGVVIKIPPRHKLIAATHLLNASGQPVTTSLKMGLTLLHPNAVDLVVAPVRVSYFDLEIPPRTEAHFTARCNLRSAYERVAGEPFDLKLYWALPHYHGLGNYYALSINGGDRDGEMLHRLQGFDAEGNGKAFTPPVDLTGADGLTATCGYNNPRRETVLHGIGNREMCDTLLFVDAKVLMDATVFTSSRLVETRDGIEFYEGPCTVTAFPRSDDQSKPSDEEIAGPLYAPPFDGVNRLSPGPSECEDTPRDAVASLDPTLEVVGDLLRASCAYSACHGPQSPAAGLNVRADDLQAALAPFVVPGDPAASSLYQRLSRCEPTDEAGNTLAKMPRNAPTLLSPGVVATIRDWIAAQPD